MDQPRSFKAHTRLIIASVLLGGACLIVAQERALNVMRQEFHSYRDWSMSPRFGFVQAKPDSATAPPQNDNFANAQDLGSANSGSVNGSNVNATVETGEPSHGGISGGKSIWYKWQAPSSSMVNFTTG